MRLAGKKRRGGARRQPPELRRQQAEGPPCVERERAPFLQVMSGYAPFRMLHWKRWMMSSYDWLDIQC